MVAMAQSPYLKNMASRIDTVPGLPTIGGLPGNAEKALYLAVLAAALERASKSTRFDLAAQCEDLQARLGNIRRERQALDQLGAVVRAGPLAMVVGPVETRSVIAHIAE